MTDLDWPNNRFSIALSFPSENREFVEDVAEYLAQKIGRSSVFYDKWYEVQLTGVNGDLKLGRIYEEMSDLVVPFFSEHYTKPWCGLEWDSIRSMLHSRNKGDAVFAIKMDNCRIAGWKKVDFYIERSHRTPQEIGDLIYRKHLLNSRAVVAYEPTADSEVLETANGKTEHTYTEVEVTDANSILCPRASAWERKMALFFVMISLIWIASFFSIDMSSDFESLGRIGHILILTPVVFIVGAVFVSYWIKLQASWIKLLFTVTICVSQRQVLFKRNIPKILDYVLQIDDRLTTFHTSEMWWNFDDGHVRVSDGMREYWVNREFAIGAEEILIFQEQLAGLLKTNGHHLQVGKPNLFFTMRGSRVR